MRRTGLVVSLSLLAGLILWDLWYAVYGYDRQGYGFLRFGVLLLFPWLSIPFAAVLGWRRQWLAILVTLSPVLYGWSGVTPYSLPAHVINKGFELRLALHENDYMMDIAQQPNDGHRYAEWEWLVYAASRLVLVYDEDDLIAKLGIPAPKDVDLESARTVCARIADHLKGHFYLCDY